MVSTYLCIDLAFEIIRVGHFDPAAVPQPPGILEGIRRGTMQWAWVAASPPSHHDPRSQDPITFGARARQVRGRGQTSCTATRGRGETSCKATMVLADLGESVRHDAPNLAKVKYVEGEQSTGRVQCVTPQSLTPTAGSRISNALRTMTTHTIIDEEAVDLMLKEISSVSHPICAHLQSV